MGDRQNTGDEKAGRVTDKKILTDDQHIHEEDKQKLEVSKQAAEESESSHIPRTHRNAALEALRDARTKPQADGE